MMRKLNAFILLIVGLTMLSCSIDDQGQNDSDCSTFDTKFPELYLKIINQNGNNLIENDSIDPNTITVEGNFPNPDYRLINQENIDSDTIRQELNNTLLLYIPYQSPFQYSILTDRNNPNPIDLTFKAELTQAPCNLSYFTPTAVEYDNENVELIEVSDYQYLVEIEL